MTKEQVKKTLDELLINACKQNNIDVETIKMNDELNILDSGIIDSLGFLELISTLEEKLGVEIDLSEHSPEDFTNYSKLIDIVSAG